MRRILVLFAGTALAASGLFALEKGETEFEQNAWFRYTANAKAFDFGNPTRSDFALERGYFRLGHQWTPALYSKATVDVLSSSAYSDGASVRLKDAYVDFTLPVSWLDARITAGLQKNYFSLIYSWDYTHLEKSLADRAGILASSDFGVTLNGFLPKGLGEFQVGAYNGEGYKKAFASSANQVNTDMAYAANLRVTPLAGVTVGGSFLTNRSDRSAFKNGSSYRMGDTMRIVADTANWRRTGIAPMAKLAFGPVSVLGEYIIYNYDRENNYYKMSKDSLGRVTDSTKHTKTREYRQSGLSVVPMVSLFRRQLELVGRYDLWNISVDSTKDTLKSHSLFGAGFNYHFVRREKGKPGVELQVLWQREQDMAHGDPKDAIMAQVRFEYSALIKP